MVTAFIFFLHLVFILFIFTKKWQDDSLGTAFTNLALITILFAVGWSITTAAAKLVFDQKGFGLYYDRDTISLTLLSIAEYFFYKYYYKEDEEVTEAGKET